VLLNPNQPVPTWPGTRILQETFRLAGVVLEDPRLPARLWTITNLFAPIPGRALGGIRAKLVDEQGFVGFVNQRDLELMLNIAKPGDWCHWADQEYPGMNCFKEGWFGICTDDLDLEDDLQEREIQLRQQYGGVIPNNVEIERKVHLDDGRDCEELLLFLWDKDPDTGYGPDGRIETISRRWVQVERNKVTWRASAFNWATR
jgi:hypothetical protein